MNPDVKAKWIAALRSGEYQQARATLRSSWKADRFCCLGVLCDLAAKEGLGKWDGGVFVAERGDSSATSLPYTVQEWAGFPVANKESNDPRVAGFYLTTLNDAHRKSFAEIADLIEKHL
jgi:hypothetical protein